MEFAGRRFAGEWDDVRVEFDPVSPAPVTVDPDQAVLATWRHLIDDGALQAGEPYLAATARPVVARICPAFAERLAVADGDEVAVPRNPVPSWFRWR